MVTALVAALLFLMINVTGYAMSEETRCKKGGGVWRGTHARHPRPERRR